MSTIKKPNNLEELLICQATLDKKIGEQRHNGFTPRKKNEIDIILALDDELQEWLKELPQEYNFKTWKQKKYNARKELEEFTDILFFYLQLINYRLQKGCIPVAAKNFLNELAAGYDMLQPDGNVIFYVCMLKQKLWDTDYVGFLETYIKVAKARGFRKQQIIDMYWHKYIYNLKRIQGEWSL